MRVERGHRRVSRGTVGGLAIEASSSFSRPVRPISTGLLVEAGGLGWPGSGLVLARGRALRSTACRCEAAPVVPSRLTALPVRVRVLHAVNSRTTISCSEPRPEQSQLPSAPAGGAGPALAGGPGFT